MATLTYWIAPLWRDPAYSIVGKTKKSVLERLAQFDDTEGFDPVEKRVIEYKDAFDLFDWCTGEGGGRLCGYHVEIKPIKHPLSKAFLDGDHAPSNKWP